MRLYICTKHKAQILLYTVVHTIKQFCLHVAVPDAPAIRRVSTGSTSITLSCQLGESNGGKPVTSVIIEIQQPNGTLRRETIEDVQNPVRHSISGLKSYTEYKLRAIAVNDMGESKPSTDSWIVTKRKGITQQNIFVFVCVQTISRLY